MIFYFSGTGNSLWVARRLAGLLGDRLVAIADAINSQSYSFELAPDESVGMVFPTYSWGPPPIVLAFMGKMKLQGYSQQSNYCYMVTTCGDDVGLSADIWRKSLPCPVTGDAAFSVQMPNNYILLPGFDVDAKNVEQSKLAAAVERVDYVARQIAARERVTDVVTGSWKRLKSSLLRAWFLRYAMSDCGFRADAAKCTSCGLCEKTCPVHNTTLSNGTPQWHGSCTMCLSCIHRCPVRAIQYSTRTERKGRYHHSDSHRS